MDRFFSKNVVNNLTFCYTETQTRQQLPAVALNPTEANTMSEFSDLLTEYTHRKDTRIYALAEYCGMDRSMMYKVIRGKRMPSSIKTLDKIAEFLHLTPAEYQELSAAYRISLEGRDNYYRRRDIMGFLGNFRNIMDTGVSLLPPRMCISSDSPNITLTNASEVNQAVYTLVTRLIEEGEGNLYMIAPPEFTFLIRLLVSLMKEEDSITITHIMCLNNNEQITADKKNYNLHCLMDILPLCTCGCHYQPYYYYDNITSRLDIFHLFPYLLLTESRAIILSETFETGFVTRQPDFLRLLKDIFSGYIKQARPLLQKISDVSSQLAYVQEFLKDDTSCEYSFQMTPCMTDLLSEDLLEKYITPELPGRQTFIRHFLLHIRDTYERHQKRNLIRIFSLEGVKEFLDTGLLEEYPSDIYLPFEPEDRLKLIVRFAEECRRETYHIRMLRQSIGTVKNGANIYITPKAGYLLFTPVGSRAPVYLNIQESGLTSAFWDFLETLDDGLFCTQAETLSRLDELIRQYSRF